jgi:hypothetical protein
MPHVVVKLGPGKSERQKQKLQKQPHCSSGWWCNMPWAFEAKDMGEMAKRADFRDWGAEQSEIHGLGENSGRVDADRAA